MLLSVVGAVFGAFLGSYFNRKGENLATKAGFSSIIGAISSSEGKQPRKANEKSLTRSLLPQKI